jgi:hypothetical protein
MVLLRSADDELQNCGPPGTGLIAGFQPVKEEQIATAPGVGIFLHACAPGSRIFFLCDLGFGRT